MRFDGTFCRFKPNLREESLKRGRNANRGNKHSIELSTYFDCVWTLHINSGQVENCPKGEMGCMSPPRGGVERP